MIEKYLQAGELNAITGQELCKIINCDIRTLTGWIEKDRRAGIPICAKTLGAKPGYFMPEYKEDIEDYTKSLKNRAIELFKTRQALIRAAEKLPSKLEGLKGAKTNDKSK